MVISDSGLGRIKRPLGKIQSQRSTFGFEFPGTLAHLIPHVNLVLPYHYCMTDGSLTAFPCRRASHPLA